jgi:hypothetical protein
MTTPAYPDFTAGGDSAGPPGPSPATIVIAPAHPALEDGERDIVFELRESAGDVTVLPVFTSVPRLVDALGHAQPWVALPLHKLRQLAAASGVRTVVLDPDVQPGAWRWGYDDLDQLPGSD